MPIHQDSSTLVYNNKIFFTLLSLVEISSSFNQFNYYDFN